MTEEVHAQERADDLVVPNSLWLKTGVYCIFAFGIVAEVVLTENNTEFLEVSHKIIFFLSPVHLPLAIFNDDSDLCE